MSENDTRKPEVDTGPEAPRRETVQSWSLLWIASVVLLPVSMLFYVAMPFLVWFMPLRRPLLDEPTPPLRPPVLLALDLLNDAAAGDDVDTSVAVELQRRGWPRPCIRAVELLAGLLTAPASLRAWPADPWHGTVGFHDAATGLGFLCVPLGWIGALWTVWRDGSWLVAWSWPLVGFVVGFVVYRGADVIAARLETRVQETQAIPFEGWRFRSPPWSDLREDLAVRLEKLLSSACGPIVAARGEADLVLAAYRSSERRYHGLEHVRHCLWELDRLDDDGLDKTAIELAIWYHDVVYETRRTGSEARSAATFEQGPGRFLPDELRRRVSGMIRASTHDPRFTTDDRNVNTFLDIDMAILGQRSRWFLQYEEMIRDEYRHVPAPFFYARRKRFLQSVQRHGVFRTADFRTTYGAKAEDNIARLLGEPRYRWVPAL